MKGRSCSVGCIFFIALSLCATLQSSWAVSPSSSHACLGTLRGGDDNSKKSWSSFFTVNPSKILSVLVNRGGLLLPSSVEKELLALSNVMHVDSASLNLVERVLVVKNFTVSVPGSNTDSLRVKSVQVTWDSYTKPCVDVQVEDVVVLAEFTNLLLTRNNWNELDAHGFPPMMEEFYDTSAPSSTFVRIGSIELSGNAIMEVRSRPLHRSIANITFGMDAFDDLNAQIRNISDANLDATNRRGCTTDEVYTILQNYFVEKLRRFLKDTVYDVTRGSLSDEESNTVREARKLFASTSSVVKSYAGDAGKKTGESIQESLASRLEKLGVPSSREKLSALRELSTSAARTIDAKSLAGTQFRRLREAYRKSKETDKFVDNAALMYKTRSSDENECAERGEEANEATETEEVKETVIIFPDW